MFPRENQCNTKQILLHVNHASTVLHSACFGCMVLLNYIAVLNAMLDNCEAGSHLELTPEYIWLITNEENITSIQFCKLIIQNQLRGY